MRSESGLQSSEFITEPEPEDLERSLYDLKEDSNTN